MIRELNVDVDGPEFFKKFEEASKFVKVNPDYAKERYRQMIANGNAKGFILIDDTTGKLAGGIGMLKGPDLHSGEMTAVETFWFVDPSSENSFGAMELYRCFERWAKETGCKKMAMIHMMNSSPAKLQRLYERMGYTLIEQHFVKEIT
jgi:GNAT superfamily N-acetyltransferase